MRARAEGLLKDGLADMRLGDRVTLARLATPPLLPPLLADADKHVVEAALINPRLREEDLTTALRRDDVRTTLVEAAAASTRWATSYRGEARDRAATGARRCRSCSSASRRSCRATCVGSLSIRRCGP